MVLNQLTPRSAPCASERYETQRLWLLGDSLLSGPVLQLVPRHTFLGVITACPLPPRV